jgi:hypothetical protein
MLSIRQIQQLGRIELLIRIGGGTTIPPTVFVKDPSAGSTLVRDLGRRDVEHLQENKFNKDHERNRTIEAPECSRIFRSF